jgi:hypothetical protein
MKTKMKIKLPKKCSACKRPFNFRGFVTRWNTRRKKHDHLCPSCAE